MLKSNPLHSGHRDRAAADLPDPHLQDRQDVPREPGGAAGGYAQKKRAGRAEPQDVRVVDDDRLRTLAAGLPRHPRQGVPVRRRHTSRPTAAAISTALEMENFAQPARWSAFYVLSMLVVGSHLWHGVVERVPVARPRPSALDAAHPRRRQGARRRSSPAASSSSPCGRTSSGAPVSA